MVRRLLTPMLGGLCLAMLSGCVSMRLAYDHAPDVAYWRLDGYAGFEGEQKGRVKQAIAHWMRWHRTTQLPDYISFAASRRAMLQRKVTAGEVCSVFDQGRERLVRAWGQALPAVAEIALTLKPSQLSRIETRLDKANQEVREERRLQDPPEERLKREVRRVREHAERLYGDLAPEQRHMIETAVAASPIDARQGYEERVERQRQVLDATRRLIGEQATREQALDTYRQLLAKFMNPADPQRAQREQRLRRHDCALWADLQNSTTLEQRRHAAERLERWLTDLQLLVDEQ